MTATTLDELRDEVLDTIDELPAGKNKCLEIANRALAIAPGHPFFLWAALTQLHWFVRRQFSEYIRDHDWITRDDGEKMLAQRLAESFAVLAKPDDGSSDRRMLLRLANLLEGLRKVVTRPSPEVLSEAAAHCAAYERTREQDYEPAEEELGLGDFFRALRARVRAWETVAKSQRRPEDFLFVPELLEDDEVVLKWGLDPVVALDDFQRWAFEEVRARKHTRAKPEARLGSFFSLQLKYEATAPAREMPPIVLGRLLAVLLVGASDTLSAAADAIKNGLVWGLEAMLRAGLDPNMLIDEDEGETLLHFAAEAGEDGCVRALLAAGADASRKTKAKKTALVIAQAKKKKKVIAVLEAPPGAKTSGKSGSAPRASAIDAGPVIAAAKKIASNKIKLWGSLFGERDAAQELKNTLEKLAAEPPSEWSDVFQGALRDRLPWQHLALATAAKSSAKVAADEDIGSEARFVVGSLTIDGSLVLTAPLVVAGDLSVSGAIVDDARAGWLVVAGDVEASGIVTQNDFLVGGDCKATHFVFASGNDHAMMIDGVLHAPLLVDDDHAIEAGEESIDERVAPDDAALRKRFAKGALDDGQLSPEKMAKLARAGKALFKG